MGLAFEMHDAIATRKRLEKETSSDASLEMQKFTLRLDMKYKMITLPSVADVFHYAFCHAGILTGNTR